jgi:biopolymer transport protein ExbD
MRLRNGNSNLKLKSSLDLTPLVDIIFLLLLFFVISSSFIQRPGIRVNLPVSPSAWGEEKERIFVSLTYDNILFVNEKRVVWEEFPEILQEAVLKLQNPILIINADEASMHGEVVKIMDIAKETGIENIAIATQPPE